MVFQHATDHLVEIEKTVLKLNLVARDACDIEQVVDQSDELAALPAQDIESMPSLIAARGRVLENVETAANRGEWIA
jgi:hypothetical protein